MGIVHLLDSETINQIAAGEVIERPSSIVKELVENSIDSGATVITVDITGGGISSIRITDNGSGFSKEDIPVAFLRHATSKIEKGSDLLSIQSLGFRGEALSSIAAVAKVELLTKKSEDYLGSRYCIEGGVERCFEDAGCPQGTTIIVNDLFYNVPARRKFLKSATTEAGYINELVNRFAISHPAVSFSLIINNRTALHTSGNGNQRDAIYSVYGREIAQNLIPIEATTELFTIHGYLGKPQIARGNRTNENYFVNGRHIKSALISRAIEEAYQPYSMQHKYPFTAFSLEINPAEIDVNIHPTKMDVRFSDGEQLYAAIRNVISTTLRNAILIPSMQLEETRTTKSPAIPKPPEYFETNRIALERASVPVATDVTNTTDVGIDTITPKDTVVPKVPTGTPNVDYSFPAYRTMVADNASLSHNDARSETMNTTSGGAQDVATIQDTTTIQDVIVAVTPTETKAPLEKGEQLSLFVEAEAEQTKTEFMQQQMPGYRIVGQVFATYWLVEMDNQLFYIDQHAAHEKILYERTVAGLANRDICSQQISPPIVLSLSLREEEVLNQNLEHFETLGFEIEHFGGQDYTIQAVPMTLFRLTSEDYFHELLDEMMQMPKNTPSTQVLERIASMSCKAAIKGNQRISTEEARNLITELLTLENPYHCPHGRPIIVAMSKYELEKKFKRII